MFELREQHEIAKRKANLFMESGQINAYFDALLELSHYKKLMKAVIAN